MDDDLVLNLDIDADGPAHRAGGKKGGRWTDRVKAKRGAKRKERPEEPPAAQRPAQAERPAKKPRKESNGVKHTEAAPERTAAPSRPPTQIISSLFTSNPKIEQHTPAIPIKNNARPSNAPLDRSSFTGLGLDPLVVTHLQTKMSIEKPTAIQRAALPALLSSTEEDTSARDVFIQSQTGSGKTLSFLLPIIQDLLPLSSLSYIDRSIGTLAIIVAPTRELAKQISDVLEALLQMRLRPPDESPDDAASGPRLTRWLVSGLLTGGSTRTHEKARLRKGVPILVSTPGRLLDHLQNTASFNVGKCRWLVLDEADRLMDLGFEETIAGIVRGLDGRRKLAKQAVEEGKSMEVGGWDWERRRRTILCSATIREDVQKLAGTTLLNPIVVKASTEDALDKPVDPSRPAADAMAEAAAGNTKFTPPSQLSQKYVVVPLKLRLVALVALLRNLLAQTHGKRTTKIIVFLSCTDSVDFHFNLLGGTSMGGDAESESGSESDEDEDGEKDDSDAKQKNNGVEAKSPLLPGASIFRLHGSLALQTRLASLKAFSAVPKSPGSGTAPTAGASSSILLCTSVASRGLDLPLVRAVIQYDLPTEGGATEYVHRVGRTARAGKGGEAWSFVAPSEQAWVPWVQERMLGGAPASGAPDEKKGGIALQPVPVDDVLRAGFGGKGSEFEARATEVQLSFERWVLKNKEHAEYARKAFLSHVRAYATHPSDEKHIFHVRNLHLGHLAKAFALREAPSAVKGGGQSKSKSKDGKGSGKPRQQQKSKSERERGDADDYEVGDAEKRMEKVVRAQGRLTKKGGKMVSSGTSDFQIAGGYDLEKLVGHR